MAAKQANNRKTNPRHAPLQRAMQLQNALSVQRPGKEPRVWRVDRAHSEIRMIVAKYITQLEHLLKRRSKGFAVCIALICCDGCSSSSLGIVENKGAVLRAGSMLTLHPLQRTVGTPEMHLVNYLLRVLLLCCPRRRSNRRKRCRGNVPTAEFYYSVASRAFWQHRCQRP